MFFLPGVSMNRKQLWEYISTNRAAVITLTLFVFVASLYVNTSYFVSKDSLRFYPPFVAGVQHTQNTHLGGEYYAIAEALAAGKGFSNPFRAETGPTAWMPPLYPLFLAALIKVLPSKMMVALVVVVLKNIVLIITGLVLYEIAKKTRLRLPASVVLVLFCLWLLCNFRWFFQVTHDEWLLLMVMNVVFAVVAYIRKHLPSRRTAIVLGMVGGVAMLTSPIAGFVWLVLTLTLVRSIGDMKKLFFAVIIMILLCSPWLIRNYLVFEKIIFMESNFYFDLYHNYQATDGIVCEDYFLTTHPYFNVVSDAESSYAKNGEMYFVDMYKKKFFEAFREKPDIYFANIKNRFMAALIVFYPYSRHELFALWQALIHPLPFFSLLMLVLMRRFENEPYIKTAIVMYAAYLAPYILVSYYVRYSIPLTQVKLLFIFWAADLCFCRFTKKQSM